MRPLLLWVFLSLNMCESNVMEKPFDPPKSNTTERIKPLRFEEGSWQHFLQNLPVAEGLVVDFRGEPVRDQSKSFAILNYDVGRRDLQQCADALIRLRAEYLFSKKAYDQIGFHFTSGHYYSWFDYLSGKRPRVTGSKVHFYTVGECEKTYMNLRNYLDIVFAYAGTISLTNELKNANSFKVGTIIITPGSPGHCCIIIDEAVNEKGEKFFKLLEGYTPAQSIYVVSNPHDKKLNPWYQLQTGTIITSSYTFENYRLKKFE